jgi:chitodextrinase
MMLQNEFLVLDLGTAKTIGRVRMRSRTGTGATFPRDFQIQASFDNVSFTTVSTTTGFTAPAGAEFSFPFPPTVARYVKVLSTRVAAYTDGKFYTQIAEIGVDQASPAPAALAITWIAPGDDGNAGRASSYDLRFSPAPILDASAFGTATPVPGVPSPGPSGSAESVVLTGLSQESRYHFALRTTDDAGNVSPLSPPANGVTKGIAPSPVTDLTASNPTLGSIELHWTATGDDGGSGTASAYAVRYSRSPLTEGNFDSAVPVTSGVPSPSPSGTAEAMTVTGLSSTTTYYFAVRVLDEAGNRSLLSNVAVASTLDDTPPGKVTDLSGFTGSLTEQRIAASVIASSGVASADYGIGKVVDGHLLTSWSTPGRTPQPEFLTLDTGAVRALSRIRLRSRDVGTLFPEDYQIQVSLDGASWTTALTLTGINLPAAAWIEHAFPPTTGRYLRLFVTKARRYSANLLYYVQIAEIEVFEAQVGAGAITLHWTAPGDDENLGTATSYSLERSTASDFSTSTLVSTAAPNAAGMVESLVVSGLSDETRYYFRLSATDDSSNVSELSNVARVDTAGTAPSAVSDLSATPRTGRRIALSWTATGDDGTTGTATRYDLRYSTSPIDSTSLTSFSVATPLAGVPAPSPAGTVENLMVTGLESERTYYFALLVLDELDNTSLLSNVAVATTFDETAPSAVSDLVAFAPSGPSYMAMPLSAIASSGDISVAFGKDKAVDGLTATSWSTPGRMAMQVELLTVQLTGAGPSGVPVGRVRLCSRDVGNLFPIDFEIQVSLENASFATVVTRTGFAATAATCYPFEFTPVSSRYVRLRATKSRQFAPDQKFYAQLSELGVDQAVSHVDRVTLRWTAPGDNGSAGKAASYDIRYSTTTPFDFDTAVPIAGEPFPKPASSSETFDVVGLSAETQYTFGLKAADEAGNVSALSNVISGTTASIPPSPVSDLSASGATASSMNLQWTAPGDDGIVGTAASYDVRYSTAPIDTEGAASFSSAIQAVGEPAPGASGTMESMTVSGLAAGTLYYFALRVLDDSAAASLVSNVVSAATLDVTAPARVLDLSASVAELLQEIAVTAVSSTGDLQASYDKHKAVDDSAATSWSTPPRNTIQTELLVVDTGSANDLARVRLCARDVAGALFPQDFEIQISLDNVSYTTVVTKVSFVAANGACYPFDFAPQSARYVRLRVTKSRLYSGNLMYYVQLAELDVFELQELTDRITLAWTAPGDDGAAGTAASYDIRYSTSPIASDAELATATPVAGAPAPHAAGTAESFTVTGLSLGTEYHFAMKTNDESGNRSLLSNSPSVTTGSP